MPKKGRRVHSVMRNRKFNQRIDSTYTFKELEDLTSLRTSSYLSGGEGRVGDRRILVVSRQNLPASALTPPPPQDFMIFLCPPPLVVYWQSSIYSPPPLYTLLATTDPPTVPSANHVTPHKNFRLSKTL